MDPEQGKATEGLIHPPCPGFRATLFSRYFSVRSISPLFEHAAFVPPAGSCLSRERVYRFRFHLQQPVILSRLAVCAFSTEAYTSTLG